MKKKLIKVVIIMGLFALILGFGGCSKKQNTTENKVKFSSYSQQERQDYIRKYLLENYGLDCVISDVKQRQITAIKNENYFFATATTESKIISVWISTTGEITDTVFLLQRADDISEFFSEKVKTIIPDCKIKVYSELRDIPTSKLTTSANIDGYFQNEPVHTYLRIFVNAQTKINETTIDELQDTLKGYEADVYLYVCENFDDLDIETYDLSKYQYSRTIEKGN